MIISKTPLRVSFFGGGTDLPAFADKHGSHILSTAINKYVYIIVKERLDDNIVLSYSNLECVKKYELDDIEHSLIREVLKRLGTIDQGLEIHSIGDISLVNGGLGGSSAYLVGLINALWAFHKRYPLNKEEIVKLAKSIEIDILKKPIGIQDHLASAFGGFNQLYIGDNRFTVMPMPRRLGDMVEKKLVLFEVRRVKAGSDILSNITKNISREDIENNLLKIKRYTGLSLDALKAHDTNRFGYLLGEAWKDKSKLPGVTNPEIDRIFREGMKSALGGKLCGAGGGGHFVFVCEDKNKAQLIDDVGLQHYDIRFDYHGTRIIFNDE